MLIQPDEIERAYQGTAKVEYIIPTREPARVSRITEVMLIFPSLAYDMLLIEFSPFECTVANLLDNISCGIRGSLGLGGD